MNTDIVLRPDAEDTMKLARIMSESRFFADSKEAAQAAVKILAGRELGFGPIASMTGIHIISNKVALSANLMAAAIKRSGRYNYRVIELTDTVCTIDFYENGQVAGRSSFTIEDAKRAGLADGPNSHNWKKFTRNMLFSRAMSNGVKWYCPDMSGGPMYTPDELGAVVDGDTGEVVTGVVVKREPLPQTNVSGNGNGNGHSEEVWATWQGVSDAIAWAMKQTGGGRTVFNHERHARNAWSELQREKRLGNSDLYPVWVEDVQRRAADLMAASQSGDLPTAEPADLLAAVGQNVDSAHTLNKGAYA